ncbi:MAG: hypothetical protein LBT58_02345 [Endomicrobium sp.]|jgi:uncharacterized protein YacL|nr:hypothetical protein [Endomicrobium sp.]
MDGRIYDIIKTNFVSLKLKLIAPSINIKFLNSKLEQIKSPALTIINIAKSLKSKILIKDFNLCKEASLRNMQVLNINDLETALLVKEGEQHNQAIGYFDDKTK